MRRPLLLLLISCGLAAQQQPSNWRSKVPAEDAAKTNPLAHEKDAAKAGEKEYKKDCAQCHGEHAEGKTGKKYRPPLKSAAMKQTSDGQLFWLLTNGSIRNGMPSWSELPDAQRWQVVSYLRKLNK